jgi:catechol 2,3-dioxygenase-like lactoylglutathione lyase family enzyme
VKKHMITGIDHFSFTVSNLNEAVYFFGDLLGMTIFVPPDLPQNAGFILFPKGKQIDEMLQMKDALLKECFLKTPDGGILELIEYINPKGHQIDLKTNNFGVAHISLFVDNMPEIFQKLSIAGVVFNNVPDFNSSIGRVACYVKGPDGITVELVQKINQ